MRVVLDPNVIISGLLSSAGPPAEILDAIDELRVLPVVSPQLVAELRVVLDRPWFAERLSFEVRVTTLDRLLSVAEHVEDVLTVSFDTDPKDAYLIALAISYDVPLVTGDRDLQRAVLPIIVRSPRQFVDLIKGQ